MKGKVAGAILLASWLVLVACQGAEVRPASEGMQAASQGVELRHVRLKVPGAD